MTTSLAGHAASSAYVVSGPPRQKLCGPGGGRTLIGPKTNAVRADADVVLVEDLRDGVVVAKVQDNVVDADVFGIDGLVARSRRSGRHAALQDESAVFVRVAARVLEAPDGLARLAGRAAAGHSQPYEA